MGHPWDSPRHRSWASDSVIAGIALGVILAATIITDIVGEPPTYLVGLLGTAAGAFFSALNADRAKRERDIARTAGRAEAKTDKLADTAHQEHNKLQTRIEHLEEGRD